jgi:hypothetical protein
VRGQLSCDEQLADVVVPRMTDLHVGPLLGWIGGQVLADSSGARRGPSLRLHRPTHGVFVIPPRSGYVA